MAPLLLRLVGFSFGAVFLFFLRITRRSAERAFLVNLDAVFFLMGIFFDLAFYEISLDNWANSSVRFFRAAESFSLSARLMAKVNLLSLSFKNLFFNW